jgi:hypothetical protein
MSASAVYDISPRLSEGLLLSLGGNSFAEQQEAAAAHIVWWMQQDVEFKLAKLQPRRLSSSSSRGSANLAVAAATGYTQQQLQRPYSYPIDVASTTSSSSSSSRYSKRRPGASISSDAELLCLEAVEAVSTGIRY